jgi:2-oxoisovalerate dehydrogenase E1 component
VARLCLTSRAIDDIEEAELFKSGKVPYQFSARGHELGQVLLGTFLTHPRDGVGAYYRSRPLLLALGLDVEDALAADLARSGSFSDGRDIGVVCNLPGIEGPTVLPMAGDVGSQFTPSAGWAQAITYRAGELGDRSWQGAMAVVLGGEGAVATNGFWSSLTLATTLALPLLFYVEDNGYAISVTSEKQTPGANIAANLASFANLHVVDGDGTDPEEAATSLAGAVAHVRAGRGPALIRLTMPRLSGHSGQDTQGYKPDDVLAAERGRDPLSSLRDLVTSSVLDAAGWEALDAEVREDVRAALTRAEARPEPDPSTVERYAFAESTEDGAPDLQKIGGLWSDGHEFPATSEDPTPEPARINMVTAIRRTLDHELRTNPKVLVFGEDVGAKGGVHAATMGLQDAFGEARVFDTSLSEEGIIGRSVGMALAGLMPVPEIQFRKYADPATEQLNNCGTIRWRTANRMAAPIVVRIPGGFFKCGDPWHSVSSEVVWAHGVGWHVAIPSNAEDAVGLLRTALRGNDPVIFFEPRYLLDAAAARRPYPGDSFVVPFGRARRVREGTDLSIITWGAMVERSERAAAKVGRSIEILDLRTISPWDEAAVLASVARTHRCCIVHEDNLTAGFGAEIAARVASKAFLELDCPVERVTTPDVPVPYNVGLMNAVVPTVDRIAETLHEMLEF